MDEILRQTLAKLEQGRNELTNTTNTVRPQQNVNQMDKVSDVLFRLRQERSGEHRQLNHENAAQELVVRWNGPSLCRSDQLLKSVQQKLSGQDTFRCVRTRRTTTIIGQSMDGTVISRHKRAADSKACLWRS